LSKYQIRVKGGRSLEPIGSQRFFEIALFAPLYWPWKVTRLERDSLQDFRHRSLSSAVSVSELYHENSKLFPQMLEELAAVRLQEDVRTEFLRRQALVWSSETSVEVGFWGEYVSRILSDIEIELFYAIEVRLLVERLVTHWDPTSGTFHLVKTLSPEARETLQNALRLMAPPALEPHNGSLLFIVGFFGRNEMLLGQRGYRRTILEAGRVAQQFVSQGGVANNLWPICEFGDREVDAAIDADGTEVGTIVVFELGDEPDVR
jgi:hypothetical protein